MAKPKPIKDRIKEALANGTQITYADLARQVFPGDLFPKAWRYQANGGPPGCYMALSKALREMANDGSVSDYHNGIGPGNRFVRLLSK